MKLVIKLANEIKDYCKSRNTCYGCPFFDEEIAYEDACSLRDRPMFWKDCGASMRTQNNRSWDTSERGVSGSVKNSIAQEEGEVE